ncbi:hypothetical protein, partial [Candidatus Hamiltonella defensa]|uniref:hypothetical protein n=1 Tax=Candidatus Williamhamiltonella defendens TaxID=138072 RepID=UPI001A90CE82
GEITWPEAPQWQDEKRFKKHLFLLTLLQEMSQFLIELKNDKNCDEFLHFIAARHSGQLCFECSP